LKKAEAEIIAQTFALPSDPTFADAANVYLDDSGEKRFIKPLALHFGNTAIKQIDQRAIDEAAAKLYPDAAPATRNRQVYSPMIAILRRAGVSTLFRRPKGGTGEERSIWLWPEQFEALLKAASELDPELAILFLFLVSTGARLSEALGMKCTDVRLSEGFAFCGKTKNGKPRPMHVPAAVVVALRGHPRKLDRGEARVFRWTRCGSLYLLAGRAYARAGVDDGGAPFHVLRHTYGTWMRRYANADERDLLETGAWSDPKSVRRYTHTVIGESARLADALPLPLLEQKTPEKHPLGSPEVGVSGPSNRQAAGRAGRVVREISES
jgi:integrase